MACSIMQKTLLRLELEQQAEEIGSSIWGGAAIPDPVNEWVVDWPAFAHGYLTGAFLHRLMCICTTIKQRRQMHQNQQSPVKLMYSKDNKLCRAAPTL